MGQLPPKTQRGKAANHIKHKDPKGTKLRVLCVLSVEGVKNRAEKQEVDG